MTFLILLAVAVIIIGKVAGWHRILTFKKEKPPETWQLVVLFPAAWLFWMLVVYGAWNALFLAGVLEAALAYWSMQTFWLAVAAVLIRHLWKNASADYNAMVGYANNKYGIGRDD